MAGVTDLWAAPVQLLSMTVSRLLAPYPAKLAIVCKRLRFMG